MGCRREFPALNLVVNRQIFQVDSHPLFLVSSQQYSLRASLLSVRHHIRLVNLMDFQALSLHGSHQPNQVCFRLVNPRPIHPFSPQELQARGLQDSRPITRHRFLRDVLQVIPRCSHPCFLPLNQQLHQQESRPSLRQHSHRLSLVAYHRCSRLHSLRRNLQRFPQGNLQDILQANRPFSHRSCHQDIRPANPLIIQVISLQYRLHLNQQFNHQSFRVRIQAQSHLETQQCSLHQCRQFSRKVFHPGRQLPYHLTNLLCFHP